MQKVGGMVRRAGPDGVLNATSGCGVTSCAASRAGRDTLDESSVRASGPENAHEKMERTTSYGVFVARLLLTALACVAAGAAPVAAQVAVPAERAYLVGEGDVLAVRVVNETDLSGEYTVGPDGTIVFPLLGRLQAAGRSAAEIEADLIARLGDGYLKNALVRVQVTSFLSKRIFVLGEVATPGPIPLSGRMTLIEAMAAAGSLTENAGGELTVVRGAAPQVVSLEVSEQDLAATGETVEVLRLSVASLREGRWPQDFFLQDGDTVFVPRVEMFYINGNVMVPGVYPIEPGVTVLRALAMAGGVTAMGAQGRVRIVRIVDGAKQEFDVELDDLVQAGDTIVVPARFF